MTDQRLASDLTLPELFCSEVIPEVTGKMLITYSSQESPPSKPQLGTHALRVVLN